MLELYKKDDLDLHQVAPGPLVFILSRVLGGGCTEPRTVLKSEDIWVMPLAPDLHSGGMNGEFSFLFLKNLNKTSLHI